uniref:RNA helicase n=1 Tax=Eptatretus burgeri TaxID=7764 RepID=A0A8C4Q639_EPTBU
MSANNQSGGQLVLAGDPKQLEPILKSFTAVKYVLVKRRVLFLATLKRTIKQLDEHSSVLSTQASTQASTPMERLAWFVEYCVFNGATTGDLQGCWSSSIREQEADMVDLLNKMKEVSLEGNSFCSLTKLVSKYFYFLCWHFYAFCLFSFFLSSNAFASCNVHIHMFVLSLFIHHICKLGRLLLQPPSPPI